MRSPSLHRRPYLRNPKCAIPKASVIPSWGFLHPLGTMGAEGNILAAQATVTALLPPVGPQVAFCQVTGDTSSKGTREARTSSQVCFISLCLPIVQQVSSFDEGRNALVQGPVRQKMISAILEHIEILDPIVTLHTIYMVYKLLGI